jgi:hypothetical protein
LPSRWAALVNPAVKLAQPVGEFAQPLGKFDGRLQYDAGMGARPEVIAAYGPILYGTGVHAHTTGFFRALHRRHPVAVMNADRQAAPADVPPDVVEMLENGRRLGTAPADVGIGIGPIEAIPRIGGRKRIGFVVWEPSRLLPSDVRLIRALDKVWTPTEWGKQLLVANEIPEEAVRVVPEGMDVTRFLPAQERTPRQRFRFRGCLRSCRGIRDAHRDSIGEFVGIRESPRKNLQQCRADLRR